MPKFCVGNFEVNIWQGGYPVWISLRYGVIEMRFSHKELADLEYAVKRAKHEARAELPLNYKEEVS